MRLPALLEQKRTGILKRWYSLIVESYPPDVSSFLTSEKDRFANPVRHTILTGLETLLNEITHDASREMIISSLDKIIRIRAVQGFTPSQAVAFVFLLKTAVRDELDVDKKSEISDELSQLETKIDNLASLASEVYTRCRQDIDRIKAREAGSRRFIENRLTGFTNPKEEK